jgi:6-phosphogluconolactonase (cycloisomerase 2 family)
LNAQKGHVFSASTVGQTRQPNQLLEFVHMSTKPPARYFQRYILHWLWIIVSLLALTSCGGGDGSNADITNQDNVARVEIVQTGLLLDSAGRTRQLEAVAYNASGERIERAIAWQSSRPGTLAVDENGVVRAVSANGSAQIVATAEGVRSAPLLGLVAAPAPGVRLVDDADVLSNPVDTTPTAAPSFTNTYRVTLAARVAPAVGQRFFSTGSRAVAGEVQAVQPVPDGFEVTFVLVPLNELLPGLRIQERLETVPSLADVAPDIAAAYTVTQTGDRFVFTPRTTPLSPPAGRLQPQAATPVGTFAFNKGCEPSFTGTAPNVSLPITMSLPPVFSLAVKPSLDLSLGDGEQRVVLLAEPQVDLQGQITATAAFEGKIECKADVLMVKLPVGGPISFFVGGLMPVGFGFEIAGRVTVADVGIGVTNTTRALAQAGLVCPTGGACGFNAEINNFTNTTTPLVNAPSLGDLRVEPSLEGFGYVELAIGNPFLKSLQFSAVQAKVGGKLGASLALETSQIIDAAYASDYKVSLEFSAGLASDFDEALKLLGLPAVTAATTFLRSVPLAESPKGAAVNAVTGDVPIFQTGTTVNFTVRLDPEKVNFVPGLGPYNVDRVKLVRRSGGTSTTVGTLIATNGQTVFNIPFTAPDAGTLSEFHAFVETRFPGLGSFPLQVGSAVSVAPQFAYVTNRTSDNVFFSPYVIDTTTGALTPVGTPVPVGFEQRSITVDPSGRFAYVVNGLVSNVATFAINASTGALTSVGTPVPTGEPGQNTFPRFITVEPSGRFAYVANFNSVSAYIINTNTGALTPVGAPVPAGDSPNSITVDPSGQFAYVANALSNNVSTFAINASTGALTPVGAAVPAGVGPSAIAVDPSGRFVYVVNGGLQFGAADVSTFAINATTGALTPVGTAVSAGDLSRDLAVDPSGRFVYVINNSSNDISAFAINATTGALTPVGTAVSAGAPPQSITVDLSGRFAYVTLYDGVNSNITAFAINPSNGALSTLGVVLSAEDALVSIVTTR